VAGPIIGLTSQIQGPVFTGVFGFQQRHKLLICNGHCFGRKNGDTYPENPQNAGARNRSHAEYGQAGEEAILASALRPEFAVPFWASSLAEQVYRAMEGARLTKRHRSQSRSRAARQDAP
jgi:hypothetical protein